MTIRPAGHDEAVLAEASNWFALSLSDSVTDAELAALDEWLDADPRHVRAFRRIADAELRVREHGGLADPLPQADAERAAAIEAEGAPRARTIGDMLPAAANDIAEADTGELARRRRGLLQHPLVRWGAASALAASLVLAVVGLPGGGLTGTPVSTAIAQTRVLTLADGSRVTLGPSSRIATAIDGKQRRVTLLAGEAFFEVAHDRSRPFWVEAGDARIQVVGTKFDVSRAGGRVQVSVLEGVVKVHEPAPVFAKSAVRVLRASQMVETADAPTSVFSAAPPAPIAVDPVPAGDWRGGRLTYIDARLGDVVADLNRYYAPGVRLADPSLADMRVAIGLRPSEMDAFVEGLPLIAPVRVSRGVDGAVVIERAR